MATSMTKTVFIKAAPETVWQYLTSSEKLSRWFNPIDSDLQENADYVFYKENAAGEKERLIWGKILKMHPPKELSYTFIVKAFNEKETLVTWSLDEAAGGTRLTLTHSGIAEASEGAALTMLCALDKGWDEHFADLRCLIS